MSMLLSRLENPDATKEASLPDLLEGVHSTEPLLHSGKMRVGSLKPRVFSSYAIKTMCICPLDACVYIRLRNSKSSSQRDVLATQAAARWRPQGQTLARFAIGKSMSGAKPEQ